MSQISVPMRIVLVSAVAFLVAWMTFLKPTTEDSEPVADTTVAAARPAASSVAKAGAAATPAAPADDLTGVPAPVARALAADKVVVLGFFDAEASEDRAVRAALRRTDRWGGRVHVAAAPVESVSRYGRIARGVDVAQSPTVVVVDRDRNATTLVGYVDTRSIDQAVVDALRASGALFADPYLRKLNDACAATTRGLFAIPAAQSPAEAPRIAKRHSARWQRFTVQLRAIPAPAKWRAFKRANVADAAAVGRVLSSWSSAIARDPHAPAILRATASAQRRVAGPEKRLQRRMDAKHVLSCGADG